MEEKQANKKRAEFRSALIESEKGLYSNKVTQVRPAYQQVADQLRDLILDGSLGAGDRLPPEAELAELFGVSRSTVREALRVLASRDLIYTTRGTTGGTFVSRMQLGQLSDYLEISLGLMSGTEDVSVANLLEARELLEVPAAGLAATHHREEQIEEMRHLIEREKQTRSRGLKFKNHKNFHALVVEATGNRLLGVMTEPVFRVLQARLGTDEMDEAFWKAVHDDHLDILERIEAGDSEGAANSMKAHLTRLNETYKKQ